MQPRSRERFKNRRHNGSFMRFPTEVLDSPAYLCLTPKARALLLDMGSQFRGNNNGDLAVPWSLMKSRGWKSKGTVERARNELLATGLIEMTRQGGLHSPNLYAFTWIEIHECGGKLDVPACGTPSSKWRRFSLLVAA